MEIGLKNTVSGGLEAKSSAVAAALEAAKTQKLKEAAVKMMVLNTIMETNLKIVKNMAPSPELEKMRKEHAEEVREKDKKEKERLEEEKEKERILKEQFEKNAAEKAPKFA